MIAGDPRSRHHRFPCKRRFSSKAALLRYSRSPAVVASLGGCSVAAAGP